MNILTHAVHTGYQFDLAKTAHDFYSLDLPGSGEVFWDIKSRPQPRNFHRLKSLADTPVKFDLALAHFDLGYHHLWRHDLPLIFKEHCLRAPFRVPEEWARRITYYCFASKLAASRWILPEELASRKIIIGMGMDLATYGHHHGRTARVLVVGQHIQARGNEKGYGNVMKLAERLPLTVMGRGSDGMPGGIGPAKDYAELLRHYRSHRVFLNPARTLGMSTLEAMATGMAVVTFRTVNSDIVRHGENGFVVETVAEAETALKRLLRSPALTRTLGRNARETIRQNFSAVVFAQRWNTLFEQAVHNHKPGNILVWEPFDAARKQPGERRAARQLIKQLFDYRRVGFDRRHMTFLPNGRVGTGAARCEWFWDIKRNADSELILELSSGTELTCRLQLQADGSWRGRWLNFERMPVVLKPIIAAGRMWRWASY